MKIDTQPGKLLVELGICNEQFVEFFYPRVRDRADVSVLRDIRSGVIFLNSAEHIDATHYEEMSAGEYWGVATRTEALRKYGIDDTRRAEQFTSDIKDKDYVDIGCGTGGVLDILQPVTRSIAGVEPQKGVRSELESLGYCMYAMPADLPRESFDVATLFHVLEHLVDPIDTLREIKNSLRSGGKIIVEVPHARDVLLQLNVFKEFTLWSEHLILHTRESLRRFLEEAGFSRVEVKGYQRYPLANHIGWLVEGKPGGHTTLAQFADEALAEEYARILEKNDQTDTLIAIAYT